MTQAFGKQTHFDVTVIGAGINGAGIARDAALRGFKVLVLDKGDIGGGTSSWSTRLIHGGLRYLEHGELRLVRESLRERETLMKIAPHLVRLLPLLIPIYQSAHRGRSTMRAGMVVYDLLSIGKTLPSYQMLSAEETLEKAPALEAKDLLGAAVYYDAQVEFAERLVLENILSAVENNADLLTYANVDGLVIENGLVSGVEFTYGPANTTGSAKTRNLINAAGPWVDELLNAAVLGSPRLIGGTKGSHIIVAPFPGAPSIALYVEARADRRPFFIIPWNGNYLIGTTDLRFEGDLDHVKIDDQEIEYLLRESNRVFPTADLDRSKIVYTYSGVRPLPFSDKEEKSITRRHFIRQHPRVENLFSIIGGKLTTYRSLAEEAVDLICTRLQRSVECTTQKVPLPGGAAEAPGGSAKDRLSRIYGHRALEIKDLIELDQSLSEVFDVETGAVAAEVVYSFRHELAQTLVDCLLRRTMVGLNSTRGLDAAGPAARIAQLHLGWSAERAEREVNDYRRYVDEKLWRP